MGLALNKRLMIDAAVYQVNMTLIERDLHVCLNLALVHCKFAASYKHNSLCEASLSHGIQVADEVGNS